MDVKIALVLIFGVFAQSFVHGIPTGVEETKEKAAVQERCLLAMYLLNKMASAVSRPQEDDYYYYTYPQYYYEYGYYTTYPEEWILVDVYMDNYGNYYMAELQPDGRINQVAAEGPLARKIKLNMPEGAELKPYTLVQGGILKSDVEQWGKENAAVKRVVVAKGKRKEMPKGAVIIPKG